MPIRAGQARQRGGEGASMHAAAGQGVRGRGGEHACSRSCLARTMRQMLGWLRADSLGEDSTGFFSTGIDSPVSVDSLQPADTQGAGPAS